MTDPQSLQAHRIFLIKYELLKIKDFAQLQLSFLQGVVNGPVLAFVMTCLGPETHDCQDLEVDASLVWTGADLALPDPGYSMG